MSTLHQLKHGLERAMDSVAEGWRQLLDRASDALTRFTPVSRGGELETSEDQVTRHGARWGLLAAQVRESTDEILVRLEAPGMEPDQFDIGVEDDYLVVRGEKRVQHERQEGRYHLMECAYGAFERAIPLPVPVDEQAARARYRHGVLQITLPKAATHRSRRIDVRTD